jgi:hypothetical protein
MKVFGLPQRFTIMKNDTSAFLLRVSAALLVLLAACALGGCSRRTLAAGSLKTPNDGGAPDGGPGDLAEDAAKDTSAAESRDLASDLAADTLNVRPDLAKNLPDGPACPSGTVVFRAESFYDSFGFTNSVAVGDFNGDRIPDLVVAHGGIRENAPAGSWPSSVSVLPNRGNGTFAEPTAYSTGSSSSPVSIATGDFNRDGFDDIAVTSYDSDEIGVFVNLGNGTFGPETAYPTGLAGSHPRSIAVGDFNGDGWLDLVYVTYDADTAWVLPNAGNGTFGAPTTYPSVAHAIRVQAADLSGDGHPDFAVLGDELVVLVNLGNGRFAEQDRYAVSGQDLAVADFDGDGRLDLGTSDVADIGVLLNVGGGRFAPRATFGSPSRFQHAMVAEDFNGDGYPDIAISNVLAEPSLNLFLNDGHGAFAAPVVYPVTVSTSTTYPWSMAAADFDGDGYLDLALGYWTTPYDGECALPASCGQVGVYLSKCPSAAGR